ncbi:LacI family DNA-binding transcriptional regulator [Diaminobutyricibacter sp. McL0608]|uniref:LacI family DNA-binding transcriptional regulator n=1 Tax=Leifsonia sp. McL0608 TaxID=3143537 RepID=UPI0031F33715
MTQKRTTLRMVAEEARVSTATVSYVLSGRSGGAPGVSETTAQRVREAARALDYHPNRSAQAVRTGRNGLVQLSLHMLSDPWSLAVADAVNRAANDQSLTTVIQADGDWFGALEQLQCDVAYVDRVGDVESARSKLASLVARGQRLVVFDETLEPDGFDVIRSKALPGCRLAVEHILTEHTDVACLTTRTAYDSRVPSRFTVYADVLAEKGLAVRDDRVAFFEDTQASAFTAAVGLLSGDDRPATVYATTDFAAIAAISAAHWLGLRVPDDVAVIGVGNTPDGSLIQPSLSTVGPEDFYRRQAEVIVSRATALEGEPGRVHEFPWSLIVRESTATKQNRKQEGSEHSWT